MISITGTPGTGKTSVARELRARGQDVLDLNKYLKDKGMLDERDEERDTFCVDIDSLDSSLDEFRDGRQLFVEGHISHHVRCDMIIVIRCDPDTLSSRLEERGYSEEKIRENVQAEILDVILCEASESEVPVCELNSSADDIVTIADKIEDILEGNTDKYPPGNIDWTEELDKWF